jgi:hypothetical protein
VGNAEKNASTGDALSDVFLVTSACMNPYGVYSAEEKFNQLLDTLSNIRIKSPDSDIVLVESSQQAWPIQWYAKLSSHDVTFYQCAGDRALYSLDIKIDPNQQMAKTLGELLAYDRFFCHLYHCGKKYRRCFKLSGRYQLSSDWQDRDHDVVDVMVKSMKFWLDSPETMQSMSVFDMKLWSWHWSLTGELSKIFQTLLFETHTVLHQRQSIFIIEHLFCKSLLDSGLPLRQVSTMNVRGFYGQDGNLAEE